MVDPDSGINLNSIQLCETDEPYDLDDLQNGDWEGDGVNSSDIFNPSSVSVGTYTISYFDDSAGCEIESELEITVLSSTTLSLQDKTVCIEEETYTLAASPTGGIWTNSLGNEITNGLLSLDTLATTNIYTYTYEATNGCISEDNLTLTIDEANAEITFTVPNGGYCDGTDNINLTATPSGGEWSGSGVTTNGIFNPANANIGDNEIIYEYSNSNNCVATDILIIPVQANQPIQLDPLEDVCANAESFELMPSSGTWSGNGVSSGFFVPANANLGENTLTYQTGSGSCTQTSETTINVLDIPNVEANGFPSDICILEETIDLTNYFTPTGGTFSGDDLENNSTLNITDLGLGSSSIEYVFDNGECSDTTIVDFTIYQLEVSIQDNEVEYCATNNTYTLNAEYNGNIGTTTENWIGDSVNDDGEFNPSLVPLTNGSGSEDIIFQVTDSQGCEASDTLIVNVISAENINAGDDFPICQNAGDIQLTAIEPAGGTWTGQGVDIDGLFNPENLTANNTYTLTYTFGNGNPSCEIYDELEVEVLEVPVVSAGADEEICTNQGAITLNGTPIGGTWIGNEAGGYTLDINSGLFTPLSAGTYDVEYTYVNNAGCTDTSSTQIYVEGIPAFNFNIDSIICIGDPLNFDIQNTNGISCSWDFGDGNTSNNCSPSHIYNTNGNYTVTLTVETPLGCNDFLERDIFVTQPPISEFLHDADNTTFICSPLDVNFTDLTNSFGADANLIWSLGNGDSVYINQDTTISTNVFYEPIINSNNNFSYVYQGDYIYSDTTFYVALTIENQCGTDTFIDSVKVAPTPIVEFGPAVDDICSGAPILFNNITQGNPEQFTWNFGDGTTVDATVNDTLSHVFYTGTEDTIYTVTLFAENNCGTDIDSIDIVVKPKDVLGFFTIDSLYGCEGLQVNLTDVSTGADFVSYNFGDGTLTEEDDPFHEYNNAGIYTIQQFANNGCSYDTTAQNVEIFPAPIIANITASANPICVGEPLTMGFETPDDIASVLWNFANQDSSNLSNSSFVFDSVGIYTIYLSLGSTNNGCVKTDSIEIEVIPEPEAVIESDLIDGCSPLTIQFESNSLFSSYCEWNFGDGNSSATCDTLHTFETNIDTTFYVTLTAINTTGCRDSVSVPILVYAQPQVAFDVDTSEFCGAPATVNITNISQNATGYIWNFGNGETSTNTNPSITYENTGDFTIELIAENAQQCGDTVYHLIKIAPQPTVNFDIPEDKGCSPFLATFENNTINANTYYWDFGNDATSNNENSTNEYELPGFYDVSLIASYDDICFDTLTVENAIEVIETPNAYFTFDVDGECSPVVVATENLSTAAESFIWNVNGLDLYENDIETTVGDVGTFNISLTAIGENQCEDTYTINNAFTVLGTPIINLAPSEVYICEGEFITLEDLSEYATSFNIDWGDGIIDPNSILEHTYPESGIYTLIVDANNNNQCFATDTLDFEINVLETPIADFTFEYFDTITVFNGVSQNITSSVIQFFNQSEDATDYSWSFSNQASSNDINPIYDFLQSGDYTVDLVAQNNVCFDEISKLVVLNADGTLFIPNAFAPNKGLGEASLFLPKGKDILEYKLMIFDSNGKLLWQTQALENGQPKEGWDGTLNGEPMPAGVYVWVAEALFGNNGTWDGQAHIGEDHLYKYERNGKKILLEEGTLTLIR